MEVVMSNMIFDSLTEHLIQKMQTEPSDLQVSRIRPGRLQDDPTAEGGLVITIHDEPDNQPRTLANLDEDRGLMEAPPTYIGGGGFMFFYYVIEFSFFFMGETDRSVARSKSQVLLGRLDNALRTYPGPTHPTNGSRTDDFNKVYVLHEYDKVAQIREAGGIGTFIWKGDSVLKFLIEYNNP